MMFGGFVGVGKVSVSRESGGGLLSELGGWECNGGLLSIL